MSQKVCLKAVTVGLVPLAVCLDCGPQQVFSQHGGAVTTQAWVPAPGPCLVCHCSPSPKGWHAFLSSFQAPHYGWGLEWCHLGKFYEEEDSEVGGVQVRPEVPSAVLIHRTESVVEPCSQGPEGPFAVSSGILQGIEPRLRDFHQLLLSPPKVSSPSALEDAAGADLPGEKPCSRSGPRP